MPGYAQLGEDAVRGLASWLMDGRDELVRVVGMAHQLKYFHDGYNKFLDSRGYPAISPPWGTLTAIDLNRGELVWQRPLGEFPELADKSTGSENYGGSIVTKGGLLFIAATNFDRKIRAFDKDNGRLLWEHALPAAGNATPALYEHQGREYLVIGAGGGKSKISAGSYLAFSLP